MTRTKKILILLMVIIISIFSIYKISDKKINYISIGDGLSLGIDSYGNEGFGYSDYIKDYLNSKEMLNIYTKKFSDKEMSINKLINTIEMDKKVDYKNTKINLKRMLSDSGVITMSIGINDLIYKMSISNSLSLIKVEKIVNEIYDEFLYLIKTIRKYTTSNLYIIGYYSSNYFDYKFNYAIEKLNEKYKNTPNIIYIDTNYLIGNNYKYLLNPQSYYPNSQGYQVISSKIIEKISKKLEKVKNIWYINNAFNYYDLGSHGGRRDKNESKYSSRS